MRKILLAVLSIITSSFFYQVDAQVFTTLTDTVYGTYSGAGLDLYNKITNITTNDVAIRWSITGTNFPATWKGSGVLGICDIEQCRDDAGNTASNGTSNFSPIYPASATNDFHLQLILPATAPTGTYYLTVGLRSVTPTQTKDVTFVVSKAPTGITNVAKDEAVSIFPNPAIGTFLNISFSGISGVKSIAIYNLIGKAISTYRVSGSSAQLDINDIPNGFYFVRLLDAQEHILATRKFTRK